ncbi:MAG: hypothetical protein L6264_08340 [Weeksellaceae bacterium]|nr:hypothetical protein [Bacteroidota bacterium]MCG2780945.1 hypothetical protein [Weeksellaceae bacterium]
MKKAILSALLGLAFVVSCEKKEENHAEQMTTEQTAADNHSEHADKAKSEEHSDVNVNLELDNGKKWKTNNEMLPFIQEQERLIKAYDSDKGDYKKLAADLNSANEKLIKSCTMTGKSHEVLHVWLTNHMNTIQQLSKSSNKEEAEKLTEALEHSMESYHHYFD